jgi:peptide/nickel transport system substrate-binding protein
MGLILKAIENDRRRRPHVPFLTKKPFRKLLVALGKVGTPSCFILPARIAATDPFKPIDEYVGSGPMRLVRNEWIPGARAVFAPRHDRGLCGSRLGYGQSAWRGQPC